MAYLINHKIGKIISTITCMVFIVIFQTVASGCSKSDSAAQAKAASGNNIKYTLDVRPEFQIKFEEICANYVSEYNKGENELQKSRTRNNRKQALQQLKNRSVINWIGTIDSLQTNSEGKAIVSIKINDNLSVKTWNNAFSDLGSNTLIPMDSALYKKLETNVKKGSKVRFSGSLFSGNEDYYEETSVSESGSMLDPEFLIKFSDITLMGSVPFATEEINLRDGPSAEAAIIEPLKKGTEVKILGNPASNGWVKASVNEKEGYVNSKYLTY